MVEWDTLLMCWLGFPGPRVRIPPSPPIFTFCEIVRNSLGAKRLGMVFFCYFEGIFEIARQRAIGNAEVRTNLFSLFRLSCG